jgi:hypothetical protein
LFISSEFLASDLLPLAYLPVVEQDDDALEQVAIEIRSAVFT